MGRRSCHNLTSLTDFFAFDFPSQTGSGEQREGSLQDGTVTLDLLILFWDAVKNYALNLAEVVRRACAVAPAFVAEATAAE